LNEHLLLCFFQFLFAPVELVDKNADYPTALAGKGIDIPTCKNPLKINTSSSKNFLKLCRPILSI